jgi:hypothetical protein
MKGRLKTFVIVFVIAFTLHYLFASDRDIWGMLFVSSFAALFSAVIEKYMWKIFHFIMKKVNKSLNKSLTKSQK